MSRLDAVWSSKSDEWSTPKELFDELMENVSFVDVDEEYADDGQRMLFLHDAIEIVKGGVEE